MLQKVHKNVILLIIFSSLAELGFSSARITKSFSAPSGQTAMMFTQEVSSRTDYTGRPEAFYFLSGYNFNNNRMAMSTEGQIGISASNKLMITMLSRQINSAQVGAVKYDILLFCENDNDCITPQDPVVTTGISHFTSFLGTELSDASLSFDRTLSFNVAFKKFFKTIPKYPCLGIQGGSADGSFSVAITATTAKSITITVKAFANQAVNALAITYIASNWSKFYKILL